jgi:hypothetical protein
MFPLKLSGTLTFLRLFSLLTYASAFPTLVLVDVDYYASDRLFLVRFVTKDWKRQNHGSVQKEIVPNVCPPNGLRKL